MIWQLLDSPVIQGDCLEVLRALPPNSVDAVVTDPPYGIGFMGHAWDQPGEHGPVRSNGTPGEFASGRPYPGTHDVGGREGVPSGQRRNRNPEPSGFGTLTAKQRKLGRRGVSRDRAGAMEAGRYDLSRTANQRFQAWCEAWAREAYRVLKPGGHMLISGGPRTAHRMTAGVEDAGFEIRDSLIWLYGSGFPKSRNVPLAIDKTMGAPDRGHAIPVASTHLPNGRYAEEALVSNPVGEYEAATAEAEEWRGWGTALKPAHEPIVVARKPLAGTVATNVLEHGTGALNIDGCRIATTDPLGGGAELDEQSEKPEGWDRPWRSDPEAQAAHAARVRANVENAEALGRWPANVLLSHSEGCRRVGVRVVRGDGHFPSVRGASGYGDAVEASTGGGLKGQSDLEERHLDAELVEEWECEPGCPVAELDRQSGVSRSSGGQIGKTSAQGGTVYEGGWAAAVAGDPGFGDTGGASRFFYCAKASRAERNAGLEAFAKRPLLWSSGEQSPGTFQSEGTEREARNDHPTVKPVELMRWLVRLVTPPGGIVLDPFTGSGTTGCAAALEGFDFVGVERDGHYADIARARIDWWSKHPEGIETERVFAAERRRAEAAASGQEGLF